MQFNKTSKLAAGATIALCASHTAHASGFAVPEISIFGLGTANAVVANTEDLGAVPYNPATAVFHPGTTISGGLIAVFPSLEVTTSSGRHESRGEDVIPIPMLQATHAINSDIAVGFGISAPFGLETRWALGDFPGFAGALAPLHPTHSKIELLDVAPTLAFKIGPETALSAGINYYYVKKIKFDAVGISNEGDGDGWGWNLSAVHRHGDWSFGAAFRSKAKTDIKGTSTTATGISAPASAELELPWRAQVGIRYQATPDLAVEFDITRTGWSSFDTLVINNAPLPGVTSRNNWDDANAYRIGATYMVTPRTQLRFGYSFDETPQPRNLFSARVPDNDRHLFSVGFGHDLGNGLAVEGGYMYVQFEDYTHAGVAFDPLNGEVNGTSLVDGNYESSVHLIGIGLSKQF